VFFLLLQILCSLRLLLRVTSPEISGDLGRFWQPFYWEILEQKSLHTIAYPAFHFTQVDSLPRYIRIIETAEVHFLNVLGAWDEALG